MNHEHDVQLAKLIFWVKALQAANESDNMEDFERAAEMTYLTFREAKPEFVQHVNYLRRENQFRLLEGVLLKDTRYVNLPKGDRQDCYTALRELIQQNSIAPENVSAALDLIPNRSMTTRTRQELATAIVECLRFAPRPDFVGLDEHGNPQNGQSQNVEDIGVEFDLEKDRVDKPAQGFDENESQEIGSVYQKEKPKIKRKAEAIELEQQKKMREQLADEEEADEMNDDDEVQADDGGDWDDEFSANGDGVHGANNEAQAAVAKFDYQSD